MKYLKADIVKTVIEMRYDCYTDEQIRHHFRRLWKMNVIDVDDVIFSDNVIDNETEPFYMDVDTDEILTETDLRDWFESMDEEDAEYYGSPEDFIFLNLVQNGGSLQAIGGTL